MYDRQGRFLEIIGVTRDISARKQNERELELARETTAAVNRALEAANAELLKLASTDALTGVWNRRHFEQAVDAAITQTHRYGHPLSLILFDIDHFKVINDRYGHQTGDMVLIEVARRVRECLRVSDLLARWDGEEFVILTPHCGEAEAAELAERVRGLLAGDALPEVGRVTSSFGVAEWARDETQDAWIKRVDVALYQAKEEGRNRVVAGGSMALTKALYPLGLTWRDAYACGEPAIDDEHRELFRLCNDLLRTVAAEPGLETLLRVWDALLSHTVEHFAHEEEILRRRGYPELEQHAESHRHLIARAMELRGQVEQRDGYFGSVVKFLYRDLVVLHLLNEDRAFFPLFASQRECSGPPRPMGT
jgi:diguanylate cyclase (GGDEF)-like protein/hemerythrin-like metal-binding protein